MEKERTKLTEKAKEILRAKGFQENQIFEKFGFKNQRIDVVGWSKEKKIAVECGHSSRRRLEELQKFFDEVIYLPFKESPSFTSDAESLETAEKPFFRRLAGLKLQLVKDDDTLFEIPLSIKDWPRDQLENELASLEEEFSSISKLFDALSHETRLRMMKRLLEDSDLSLSFADFMRDLELNPKLVWENTRKLSEGGLLEKTGKGQYRTSELGQTGFMMMSLALRHLIETLENLEEI